MSSIPNGAFLAPHSCHDALRKEMEFKRLERQTSTSVTPDGTPPGSPRKYDPGSSPLANLKNFLWPSIASQQTPQSSRKMPEIIYPRNKSPTIVTAGKPPTANPGSTKECNSASSSARYDKVYKSI